mmetsp:Transcript_15896/g.60563  ORF Transcript_15896/g.60563 Transcript_15896/m.60563 type:complete len:202 (-) Transcript_15896:55-660(-)
MGHATTVPRLVVLRLQLQAGVAEAQTLSKRALVEAAHGHVAGHGQLRGLVQLLQAHQALHVHHESLPIVALREGHIAFLALLFGPGQLLLGGEALHLRCGGFTTQRQVRLEEVLLRGVAVRRVAGAPLQLTRHAGTSSGGVERLEDARGVHLANLSGACRFFKLRPEILGPKDQKMAGTTRANTESPRKLTLRLSDGFLFG